MGFQVSMEQLVCSYEETVAKLRAERETDLVYLRRMQPTWTDDQRIAHLLMCAVVGRRVQEAV